METIQIEKIVVKSNPRKDLGDLTELAASIKEHGIIQPIVLNSKKELQDGSRRLTAAKIAGIKNVPYITIDSDGSSDKEIKLIANIQRKDLTFIEEGNAFSEYLKSEKKTVKELAIKISKSESYIQTRINLIALAQSVQDALNSGKIQIGHAKILGELDQKKQEQLLKEIIKQKFNVKEFVGHLRYTDDMIYVGDIPDEIKKKYAGQKSLLQEFNAYEDNRIIKTPDLVKDMAAYEDRERKALTAKGITVMDKKKASTIPGAKKIYTYQEHYKYISANLPKLKDAYAVVFSHGYNDTDLGFKKEIWLIDPKNEYRGSKAKKEDKTTADEKMLNLSNKEKLQRKVAEFKRNFLLHKGAEKALKADHEVIDKILLWNTARSTDNESCLYDIQQLEETFKLSTKEIESHNRKLVGSVLYKMFDEALTYATEKLDVSLDKDFSLSEEFLELFTKEQLLDLAKELKIKGIVDGKKSEMITNILADKSKHAVPKILIK